MSVINALVDAGHSHESEIFQTVMQAHNDETTRLRQQLEIAVAALKKIDVGAESHFDAQMIVAEALAQIRELEK